MRARIGPRRPATRECSYRAERRAPTRGRLQVQTGCLDQTDCQLSQDSFNTASPLVGRVPGDPRRGCGAALTKRTARPAAGGPHSRPGPGVWPNGLGGDEASPDGGDGMPPEGGDGMRPKTPLALDRASPARPTSPCVSSAPARPGKKPAHSASACATSRATFRAFPSPAASRIARPPQRRRRRRLRGVSSRAGSPPGHRGVVGSRRRRRVDRIPSSGWWG